MSKEMLINVSAGEECRIAVLENGRLDDFHIERNSNTSHVGNIYKGKVTNVEPSIQAAFVDFGLGRNGFLHISDLQPSYFGGRGEEYTESVGRKLARRDRPPIQKCLRRGDEILVQIIKEGIGTKGPTLSTYLSIPGHILVMMPGMDNFGVSRKIEDEVERRRLRRILDELDPVEGVGFIVRTAGMGKTKEEIQRDLVYLTRLWHQMQRTIRERRAPVELYTEGDLVTRTVRDAYTPDIQRIVVDQLDVARRIRDFFKLTTPETARLVEYYDGNTPLFHTAGVEEEIEKIYARHVPLPSGGSLVIDSTEAIVAIDVNSGKFRDHSDAEITAFKTDMEAADEICRQLKLRDLGGVIICDFIDLRAERHRRELEQRILDHFKRDKAKTKVLRMSQFGIVEITRQRMRPSLQKAIHATCPHCHGTGWVKTPESLALDLMRRLTIAAFNEKVVRLELTASVEAGNFLLNRKRAALAELEQSSGKVVEIRADSQLGLDEFKLELLDAREGKVFLAELGMTPETSGKAQSRQRPPATPRHAQQLLRKLSTKRVDDLDDLDTDEAVVDDVSATALVHEDVDEAADDTREEGDVDAREEPRGGRADARDDGRGDGRTREGRGGQRDDGRGRGGDSRGGWDREGRDRDGRDRDGRDREGRDRGGRDRDGRDRDGRDRDGRDRDGRDRGSRDGRGRDGAGRDGRPRDGGGRSSGGRDGSGRNDRGWQGRDGPARDGGRSDGRGRDERGRDGGRPHQPLRAEDLLASGHTSMDEEGVMDDLGEREEFAAGGGGSNLRGGEGQRDDRGGDRGADRGDSEGRDGPRRRRRRGGRGRNRNRNQYGPQGDGRGGNQGEAGGGYDDRDGPDNGSGRYDGAGDEDLAEGEVGEDSALVSSGSEDDTLVAGSATIGAAAGIGTDTELDADTELGDAPEEVVDEHPTLEHQQPGIPPMPTSADLDSYDSERERLDGDEAGSDAVGGEAAGESTDDADAETEDESDAEESADEESGSRRRSGGRTAKPAAKGKKSVKPSKKAEAEKPRGRTVKKAAGKAKPADTKLSPSEARKVEEAVKSRRPVRTPPPGVKTGAGDRHLASDEPVAEEPVRRPRSSRDLDAIPDDYD